MEIISNGEAGIDIIDLGDISAPQHPAGVNDNLEVHDIPGAIPGAPLAMPGVPPAAEAVKPKTWREDGDHSQFLNEIEQEIEKIPPHSGQTTVGCERAIAFLKAKDAEISKAVRSDIDNKIDEHRAEALRESIWAKIDRLEEALAGLMETKSKKRRKAAAVRVAKEVVARIKDGDQIEYYVEVSQGNSQELLPVSLAEPTDEQVQLFVRGEAEVGLTKEAATSRVFLFEDPFLHAITRILINSHVSAGRNIEEVYSKLKDKYAFTAREELSIQELLLQKGMPIVKDFGRTGEGGQDSDGGGIEGSTSYYA